MIIAIIPFCVHTTFCLFIHQWTSGLLESCEGNYYYVNENHRNHDAHTLGGVCALTPGSYHSPPTTRLRIRQNANN